MFNLINFVDSSTTHLPCGVLGEDAVVYFRDPRAGVKRGGEGAQSTAPRSATPLHGVADHVLCRGTWHVAPWHVAMVCTCTYLTACLWGLRELWRPRRMLRISEYHNLITPQTPSGLTLLRRTWGWHCRKQEITPMQTCKQSLKTLISLP